MEIQKCLQQEGLITRYTRNAERTFFFYATLAMFVIWGFMRLFGG